ncbi:asparaginase [Microbacterium marinilacus]|uniref:asparaginase n=1 Tax=Microbacterium marinilacus TaxID=415209 RepID=A0ABP7B5W4_9MICO|nr:asparaginase [Microbacterium marinilacus]MBY0689977.1 asparaginase [Microbacterium marinilacus]
MSHVVLLGTGGTIASRDQAGGGARATDGSATLIAQLEGAADGSPEVRTVDVLSVNSFNLTLGHLRSIGDAVRAALAEPDALGVVVTHGTDTLEETAAYLAAVHADPRPVVLTGAQRAADRRDSDGPANLADAIRVAGAEESRSRGVLVSFSGEIHAALGIRKTHTIAPRPFSNTLGGPLGRMADDGPAFHLSPAAGIRVAQPGPAFDGMRVDIVLAYPGADGGLIDAAIAQGAAGVVVLGGGSGNPGREMTDAIARATAGGVVVALGTRTGAGPVQPVYGGGGAVDAVEAGAVPLGPLPATQARVLLAMLLSAHPAPEAAERLRALVSTL